MKTFASSSLTDRIDACILVPKEKLSDAYPQEAGTRASSAPIFWQEKNGEFEVRVNDDNQVLLGKFPSKATMDLFYDMIIGLCGPSGCSCGDLEAHLAAA
jgi:hypothetical protein